MFLILLIAFLILCYLVSRLTVGIAKSSTCLIGKTAIITGANSGIGYQVALNLASRGCRIIMADVADMDVSKNNIVKITGNANIVTKKLDLASFKSVREFAKNIVQSEDQLHILINNAGIAATKDLQTDDGLNPVMQINYFGPFLLTHLLIGLLKKSAPSRIVFTSSAMAFFTHQTLEKLRSTEPTLDFISLWQRYGNSKLATLIAADIFAEKLKDTRVTSNSLHPGGVVSPFHLKFFTEYQNIFWISFVKILLKFFKTQWEGAQTTIYCAVSTKLENVSGKYFWDCKPFFKPWAACKKDFCKKLWEISEECVGLEPHEKL